MKAQANLTILTRKLLLSLGVLGGSCWFSAEGAQAQQIEFQPRRSSGTALPGTATPAGASQPVQLASDTQPATNVSPVSADLLEIYASTKTANTETKVSAIVDACARVGTSGQRSDIDRSYARSLLAWALNRRGEILSDQASQRVAAGELELADQLDRRASRDFEQALQYAPDSWRTHHNYAISLAMKGAYYRAIDELDRAIELNPEYANAYFNRAELQFELQDFAAAVQDYTRAIEHNRADAQFYNGRAHSKFMLEQYTEALSDYRQAAELDGQSAVYHTDLADAHQFLGNWAEAAKGYQAAVAADNTYGRAYQNAAWLMATCPEQPLRNPTLAVAAAKKALQLEDRKSAALLDTLAAATAAAGQEAEAARIQQQALQLAADPTEKAELEQRLKLYQQGLAYRQAKPLPTSSSSEIATEPAHGSSRIRTASNGEDSGR